MESEKTVFISYRRNTSRHLARAIFQELEHYNYDVFLDVSTIDSGQFDKIIVRQIRSHTHFILIVSKNSLKRCTDEDDWIRREIEEALRNNRNIIPIVDEDANFAEEIQYLPADIRDKLSKHNALPISHYYFDAAMDYLRSRFLKKPEYPIVLDAVPPQDLEELERHKPEEVRVPRPIGKKRFRVFFIACDVCDDALKTAMIRQNQYQSLFELDVAQWRYWGGRISSEKRLRALQTNSKREFAEAFQAEMTAYNRQHEDDISHLSNIAITSLEFPQNFYTWNTVDKRGIVIGVKSLHWLFGENKKLFHAVITRILQRTILYTLRIPDLKSHDDTKGCLFDFTSLLADLKYSATSSFLCDKCRHNIVKNKGEYFAEEIEDWLQQTVLTDDL